MVIPISSTGSSLLNALTSTCESNNFFFLPYSIAVLPDGFASVGEDRSLRIWKNDDNPQVIVLPAMSIWSVAALSSGDIVTGSR